MLKKITASFFMFGYILSIDAQPENIATSLKFEQVINKIEGLYVDSVDGEDLTEAAIIALLEKLDPHSTYMPKKDANNARSQIDGSFVGIGIRFNIIKDISMIKLNIVNY